MLKAYLRPNVIDSVVAIKNSSGSITGVEDVLTEVARLYRAADLPFLISTPGEITVLVRYNKCIHKMIYAQWLSI